MLNSSLAREPSCPAPCERILDLVTLARAMAPAAARICPGHGADGWCPDVRPSVDSRNRSFLSFSRSTRPRHATDRLHRLCAACPAVSVRATRAALDYSGNLRRLRHLEESPDEDRPAARRTRLGGDRARASRRPAACGAVDQTSGRDCAIQPVCRLRGVLAAARDAVLAELDKHTVGELSEPAGDLARLLGIAPVQSISVAALTLRDACP
ncbi:hypothetical protein BURKHO8Y_190026 [Burkholderia sp. 8Y]|nr:hypothetical protein BURKHO8Y_190026 [Burkholderia sp. 8Y]